MDGDSLHALDVAYDELVERAVAAGLPPAATSWTLREQAARWSWSSVTVPSVPCAAGRR